MSFSARTSSVIPTLAYSLNSHGVLSRSTQHSGGAGQGLASIIGAVGYIAWRQRKCEFLMDLLSTKNSDALRFALIQQNEIVLCETLDWRSGGTEGRTGIKRPY